MKDAKLPHVTKWITLRQSIWGLEMYLVVKESSVGEDKSFKSLQWHSVQLIDFRNLSLSVVLLQRTLLQRFSNFKEFQELGCCKHIFPGHVSSKVKSQLCNPRIPWKIVEVNRGSCVNSSRSLWVSPRPGSSCCMQGLYISFLSTWHSTTFSGA